MKPRSIFTISVLTIIISVFSIFLSVLNMARAETLPHSDKYLHTGGSAIAAHAGVRAGLERWQAVGMVLALGAVKEATDSRFSKADMTANALGALTVYLFDADEFRCSAGVGVRHDALRIPGALDNPLGIMECGVYWGDWELEATHISSLEQRDYGYGYNQITIQHVFLRF